MGLFDFFRRKPSKPPEEDFTPHAVDLPEARCHHYYFAHYALRSIAFQDPLAFLAVLNSEDAERFLHDVLRSVTEHCRKSEPDADFSIEDIILHKTCINLNPCIVLEMPAAYGLTEAIFIAAVLVLDLSKRPPPLDTLRYFTLEVGISLEGPSGTVLREWTAEGAHLNHGDGPKPKLDSFVQAVKASMKEQR